MSTPKIEIVSCAQCHKVIKQKQYLKCSQCNLAYDLKCTGKEKLYYLMDKDRKTKWICDKCKRKKTTTKNYTTPVSSKPTEKQSQDKTKKTHANKKPMECDSLNFNATTSATPNDTLHDNTDNITRRKKNTTVINIPTDNSFDSLQTDLDNYEEQDITCSTPQQLNRSCPTIMVKSHLDYEALHAKLDCLQQKYVSAENQIELLLSENFTLKKTIEEYKSKLSNLTSIYKNIEQPSASKSKSDSARKSSRKKIRKYMNDSQNTESFHGSSTEEVINVIPQADCTEKGLKPKISILSSSSNNNILKTVINTFQDEYDLCHFKTPHRGVLDLLQTIDEKTRNFTKDDFCVIMIGEKDFETSQNYKGLVKNIRNRLIALNKTNVILCLPTFKCGRLTQLFNRRIEIFNRLLYLDIQEREYAYLLDSNLHLTYDYHMFSGPQGIININGIKNIMTNLKYLIDDINLYNCKDDIDCETSDIHNFFRI
ncbi:hypothetical protein ABMA27_010072 [Loxostege sticticalis]|uniref:Zinc finger PHD-type domain-containing protein n=1 Tax=Loxostege sticticalis TaxID=481309 RepID=A0ABR3H574_LOXSC